MPIYLDTEHVTGKLVTTENEALRSYRNIAAVLKEDSCVTQICSLLESITSVDIPETGFDF